MTERGPEQPQGAPEEDSFRSLFDFLPIGAYRSAPDGAQLRANPAFVRLNGYRSEAEFLAAARDLSGWYVDPLRRQHFRGLLERDGQVRAFVSEVYRHRTRERIWVSENAHVVRRADGSSAFYEGTVEEITERVRAEGAMLRSMEQLRQITEHIPGMVYQIHFPPRSARRGDHYYSFVSSGVRKLYGIEPEVLLADPLILRRMRHPDDLERIDRESTEAVASAAPLIVEYRIVVDGEVRWVQRSSSAATTERGERVRVGLMLDVTAQYQARALRAERDRAEGARQQMTQFLSRVSHELRTPLNAILGFAQLIDMEADTPPTQQRWARALLDSGHHLLDLVTEVLDLTGAQSGQMRFDIAELNLGDVLREAWAMVQADAALRGLLWSGIPEAAAAAIVKADRRRLLQVLANLLSNAVKYNRTGGLIELGLRLLPQTVELDVRDTGTGMTPVQLARLFTPFDRLGAQHGDAPGSGLGLAVSRQLAEGMAGSLEAASLPGHGSTFTLRLPRAAG